MQTVIENIPWMGVNIALAGLGLIFGWLFFYIRKRIISHIFFILWVLFIPNTIYLITDLQHLPKQLPNTDLLVRILLGFEYLVIVTLGILTFIVGMYPMDKFFRETHLKKKASTRLLILFILNCLIGFAIVLGKFQRTHSWYLITEPQRAINDIFGIFKEPVLLVLVFVFAIVINLTYFAFRNIIHVRVKKQNR